MKGQRVTGKVPLLQIQGDAQSPLGFLPGSGWEAAQALGIISLQLPSPIYIPCSEGFGDEGRRPSGFPRVSERDPGKSAPGGDFNPRFFFNLRKLTRDFWCAAEY